MVASSPPWRLVSTDVRTIHPLQKTGYHGVLVWRNPKISVAGLVSLVAVNDSTTPLVFRYFR